MEGEEGPLWLVSPASTILDASDKSAEERQRNLDLESNTRGHVSKVKETNVLCLLSHQQILPSSRSGKGRMEK